MAEYRWGGPPISIKAEWTILNPWYELPTRETVIDPSSPSTSSEGPEITPRCRVELSKYDLALFFQNNEVVFVFTGTSLAARHLVNPIRYFLTYRTFINYNLIWPASIPSNASGFDEAKVIRFKVERILRVETERQEGDQVIKAFHHTGKDEWLEIAVDDLIQYLRILQYLRQK